MHNVRLPRTQQVECTTIVLVGLIHTVPSMHNGPTTDTAGGMHNNCSRRDLIHTVPRTHNWPTRTQQVECRVVCDSQCCLYGRIDGTLSATNQPSRQRVEFLEGTLVLCGCYGKGSFVLGRDYNEVRVSSSFPSLSLSASSFFLFFFCCYVVCDVKPNTHLITSAAAPRPQHDRINSKRKLANEAIEKHIYTQIC